MVDTVNVSLNDTFSIEEDKSFLNNFGTPVNFKKLMEKPAINKTEDNFKDMFDGIYASPVNISLKSKEKFSKENYNALNSTKYHFISPLTSGKKNRCLKSNFSPIGFSEMSPICKKDPYSPLMQIGNVCCQSTPNQKENSKINSQFNLSKRTENKSIGFVTPDKKINLKFSPNSSLLWNLNRRKVAAENNNKMLMEEKLKEKENEDVDFNGLAKSFEDKLRKYAFENLKASKDKNIEKSTEISVKIQDLPPKISTSPDIRAAFLARKAKIQENQKLQNQENSPPDMNINVSLENNIRAYGVLLKNVLNGQKLEQTPKSIKQTNNTNSSFNSTPATVNKKKLEFVTPLTGSVRTKKMVPTPTRWK